MASIRAIGIYANQVGAVYVVHGQLFGLELFDSPVSYQKYAVKLINSYALEALDTSEAPTGQPTRIEVANFLYRLSAMATEVYQEVDMGFERTSAGA